MAAGMEWSIHPPSVFVDRHQQQLLPGWSQPIGSMLLILQRSPCALMHPCEEVGRMKDRLRLQFLQVGDRLCRWLWNQGYAAEIFDPRTGYPIYSSPGTLVLDDVAIVQTLLGYKTMYQGDCCILIHPHWQDAVYPSTLVSSASPRELGQLLENAPI